MKKNYERSNRKCCDPEGVIRRLVCNVLSWKSVIISRKRIRDMRLNRNVIRGRIDICKDIRVCCLLQMYSSIPCL